jgi:hypothetical protein
MIPDDLVTVAEASQWATHTFKRKITSSNISYLIQYGRITKYGDNGNPKVSKQELHKYYQSFIGRREIDWKAALEKISTGHSPLTPTKKLIRQSMFTVFTLTRQVYSPISRVFY